MTKNSYMTKFIRIFMAYAGFIFLYLPIVILVIFSFNDSKFVTIWNGFSFKWYREILADQQLISSIIVSIKIASIAATGAVILGIVSGFALSKFGNFRGRESFLIMLHSQFIIPEVIIGFVMLLAFFTLKNIIGWPSENNIYTIVIAHITLGMSYVAVLIQSRLSNFDKSLEEAALDLGAKPMTIFIKIIIPHILPSIIAGWLLAFTLSFDDLVIASFNAGPMHSTLPMYIYSKVKLGVNPEINVFASLMILAIVTVGCFIYYVNHKSNELGKK